MQRRNWVAVVIAGCVGLAAALLVWSAGGDSASSNTSSKAVQPTPDSPRAAKRPPSGADEASTNGPAKKTDETSANAASLDPFLRLLYLHYNAKRELAVLNHDSEVPRRTYFLQRGNSILGGTVRSVTAEEVIIDHPERGEIKVPFLGIAEAAVPIERPFDARREALGSVYSPDYDFDKEAEVNAAIARSVAKAGKGRGNGRGGGGGRGMRRKRNGPGGREKGFMRGRKGRRSGRGGGGGRQTPDTDQDVN